MKAIGFIQTPTISKKQTEINSFEEEENYDDYFQKMTYSETTLSCPSDTFVIPYSWFKYITNKKGKADVLAITIFAKILEEWFMEHNSIEDEELQEGYCHDIEFGFNQLSKLMNSTQRKTMNSLATLIRKNLIKITRDVYNFNIYPEEKPDFVEIIRITINLKEIRKITYEK